MVLSILELAYGLHRYLMIKINVMIKINCYVLTFIITTVVIFFRTQKTIENLWQHLCQLFPNRCNMPNTKKISIGEELYFSIIITIFRLGH